MSDRTIRETVERHRDWIAARKKHLESVRREFPPRRFADGERFYLKGEKVPLVLDDEAGDDVRFEQAFITCPGDPDRIRRKLAEWYRREAGDYLEWRVGHFADMFELTWRRVGITSARSRWGSCSRSGSINFSWRLLMCPPEIIDYVVIHELAHLKELSHSPRFWSVVEQMCPDYRRRRQWLRRNTACLKAF